MAFPDGWQRKCAIVIQAAQVAETLTDFPLLVTGDNLPAEIWANADDGGGDLRFSADDVGSVRLACEIVSFSTSGETAEIYVKVPSVSSAVNTSIWIWYNNTGQTQPAATDTYGSQAVWGSDYAAVYHFNQNPAGGTLLDSTANGNNGTANGSMDAADLVDGQIGAASAWDFDGNNDNVLLTSNISTFKTYTFLTIFNTANADHSGYTYIFDSESVGRLVIASALISDSKMSLYDGSWDSQTVNTLENEWVASDIIANAAGINRFYQQAILRGSYSGAVGKNIAGQTRLGSIFSGSSSFFFGKLDEFRVFEGALSANKITTQYNNLFNPATFAIAGTPENAAAIELTINDLTIPVNLAAGAITQTHQINADDVTAPVTLDDITLTQIHQIVANALTIPVALDNGTLTQTHILAINDMLISVGLDNLTVVTGSVVNGIAKIQLTLTRPGVNMQITTPAIKMTLDA